VKVVSVTVNPHLRAVKSLHPHFQHALTDFGKILCKKSAHICEFRENLRSEGRATDSTYTRVPRSRATDST